MNLLRMRRFLLTVNVCLVIPLILNAQGKKENYTAVIQPSEVTLNVGESQLFTAFLQDKDGNRKDTTFTWAIQGKAIGTLDSQGLFTAIQSGRSKVEASAGKLKASSTVIVPGDDKGKGLHITVSPQDTVVAPGKTIQFIAVLTDSGGNQIDTTFSWSSDSEIGVVDDSTGLFTAGFVKDQGFVWATAGNITGKGHVVVRDTLLTDSSAVDTSLQLIILPSDTVITPGSQLRMQAYLEDTLGIRTLVQAEWKVLANRVGTMTTDGLFSAEALGTCLVRAKVQGYTAHTRIYIANAEQIAVLDSAKFRIKDRNGNQIGNLKRLAEKEVLKISGLPFPLNVLNGAELALPPGSLEEEVTIDVALPDVHEIVNDSTVTFLESILNGIAFHVYIGDSLVERYDFPEPVELVLPYKPELLDELGLTVDDLWIFFYSDSAGFDSTGLTDVVVDTAENKIYALVHHFSQIVIAPKNLCTCLTDDDITNIPSGVSEIQLPASPQLYANYPNPFNPETTIRFYVPGTLNGEVTLSVYNLLGQEVKRLHQGTLQAGYHTARWNGTNEMGKEVSSGVYICRMEAGKTIQNKRMILMR